MTKERLTQKIADAEVRLTAYKAREIEMLTGGVQSYGIGSRNLTRYSTDLGAIRTAIAELEQTLEELHSAANGQRPRKAVGIIPRDW